MSSSRSSASPPASAARRASATPTATSISTPSADVLVIGGGIAGLQAALSGGGLGRPVLVLEQTAHWGGRAPVDGGRDRRQARRRLDQRRRRKPLKAMENVTLRLRCMGAGRLRPRLCAGLRAAGRSHARRRPAAPPAVAHPRRPDRHRHRRDRAAADLCRQRHSRRHAGLGGARLRGRTTACQPGRPHGRRHQQRRRLPHRDRAQGGRARRAGDRRRPRRRPTGALPEQARARRASGSRPARPSPRSRAASASPASRSAPRRARARCSRRSPATRSPCRAAGRRSCISGRHCGGKLTLGRGAGACSAPIPTRPPTGADGTGFVIAAGAANGALQAGAMLADADAAGRRGAGGGGPRAEEGGRRRRPTHADEAPLAPVWMMPQGAGVPSCGRRCGSTTRTTSRSPTSSSPRGRATRASSTPSATPRSAWRRIRES